jgi:hypothetical protein
VPLQYSDNIDIEALQRGESTLWRGTKTTLDMFEWFQKEIEALEPYIVKQSQIEITSHKLADCLAPLLAQTEVRTMLRYIAISIASAVRDEPGTCCGISKNFHLVLRWYCRTHQTEHKVEPSLSRLIPICSGLLSGEEEISLYFKGNGTGSHLCHFGRHCHSPLHIIPESYQSNIIRNVSTLLLVSSRYVF